jgi:hypothetical protein
MPTQPVRRALDDRGVALPLALIGLVVVSLLVTTAILTSSTESDISQAYVDGTQSLYDADGALQSYVASFAGTELTPGTATQSSASGGSVRITTTRLSQRTDASNQTIRVFSLLAQPVRGTREVGRPVVAMVTQTTPPPPTFAANITSSITLGGDLHVNGNSFTVSGLKVASDTCTPASSAGVEAVRGAIGSDVTANNQRHMDNFVGANNSNQVVRGTAAIENSGLSKADLAQNVLGGQSLNSLVAGIPLRKKWGPRFGRPAFDGRMDAADTVAVVDGNGGVVDLYGGSGLFIVVNGDVRMRGNASFHGIIITEGAFDLAGTPDVTGALISLDTDGNSSIDLDQSAIGSGNVTVQYQRCEIIKAMQAFQQVAAAQPPTTSQSFAWFEMVR